MHSDDSGSNEFEYDPLSETQINGVGKGSIGTAPERIAVYRLEAEIGRGGMGVVYQAIDSTLQRRVALKLLLHSAQIDVTSVKRFHNEALAAAKLSHPNIVHVHNVGEDKGIHFIAMQFIDGSNLQQIMKRIRDQVSEQHPVAGSTKPKERDQTSPMTPGGSGGTSAKSDHDSGVEWSAKDFTVQRSGSQLRVGRRVINGVAKLGADVADALQHAHEMGIIHRDIKPSNLMLDKSGRIWVSDFGLAHISTNPGLTRTGAVLGTYRYMSPEQAAGNHHFLDHRSDVYSLGATLFEMIALRPAYDQQGSEQILKAILYAPTPSLSKICRDVPSDLSLILETAMAKNPADRYATAGEMAEDLRRFLNGQPVKASPLPAIKKVKYWISRHQKLAVGVVAGLVCAMLTSTASAFLLFGAFEGERAARQETEKALQVSEGLRSLANAGLQLEKSPGLSLALALNAEGSPLLEQRQAIQEAWDRCHEYAIYEYPAGVASMVRCSRDGSRVVTCAYLGQTPDGGPSCRIHDTKDGSLLVSIDSKDAISSAVFSPDGRYVLTATEPPREEGRSRAQQMSINPCLYDAQTGKFVRRFEGMTIREADESCFSADGNRLLLCRGGDAVIVDLSNSQQTVLRGEHGPLVRAMFSRSGQRVLTLSGQGILCVKDAESLQDLRPSLKVTGDPWEALTGFADGSQKILVRDSQNLQMFAAAVVNGQPEPKFKTRKDGAFCECPDSGIICLYSRSGDKVSLVSPRDFESITELLSPTPITSVTVRQSQRLVIVIANKIAYLFDSETGQLRSTLKGHTAPILDACVHGPTSCMVTGGNDQTIRLWYLESGLQRQSYPRNPDELDGLRRQLPPVYSRDGSKLALSCFESQVTRFLRPDGTWLPDELPGTMFGDRFRPDAALLTTDNSWRVHDVSTGKLQYQRRTAEKVHPNSAVVGDGNRLLQQVLSDAYLVNLETRSRQHLLLEGEEIRSTVHSQDDQLVLVGTAQGKCRLYDAVSGQVLWQQELATPIRSVALSADNSKVAVINQSGFINVWTRSDDEASPLQLPANDRTALAFLDSDHLLTWHPQLGQPVRCLELPAGKTIAETEVGARPDAVVHRTKPAVYVNSDAGEKLWEPLTNNIRHLGTQRALSSCLLADRVVAIPRPKPGEPWKLVVWSIEDASIPPSETVLNGVPERLSVSASEDLFAVSFQGFGAIVCDSQTGQIQFRSFPHDSQISFSGFDKSGETLVTVSPDGQVGFSQATGGTSSLRLSEGSRVTVSQFSPDGTLLAMGTESGKLALVGVNEKRLLNPPKSSLTAAVMQMTFDDSGRHLAALDKNGVLQYLDLQTEESKEFQVAGATGMDVSPDGQFLLIAGVAPEPNGLLTRIEVASGKIEPLFNSSEGPAVWASYSPDGKSVAAIQADDGLVVRKFTGEELLVVKSSSNPVLHAAFLQDGHHLMTSHPERLSCWDLECGRESVRIEQEDPQFVAFHESMWFWNPGIPGTTATIDFGKKTRVRSLEPENRTKLLFQRSLTASEQETYSLSRQRSVE